jgi:hypothetical protein
VVHANVHNFVLIVGIALLGFILIKRLAGTGLANVPVLGQVLSLAKTA